MEEHLQDRTRKLFYKIPPYTSRIPLKPPKIRNYCAKFCEEDIIAIIDLAISGAKFCIIKQKYGISPSHITHILHRDHWLNIKHSELRKKRWREFLQKKDWNGCVRTDNKIRTALQKFDQSFEDGRDS